MRNLKWWELLIAAVFAALFNWFLLWMIEQGNDCERRGGVMVYKTGCIKAQRI